MSSESSPFIFLFASWTNIKRSGSAAFGIDLKQDVAIVCVCYILEYKIFIINKKSLVIPSDPAAANPIYYRLYFLAQKQFDKPEPLLPTKNPSILFPHIKTQLCTYTPTGPSFRLQCSYLRILAFSSRLSLLAG